MRLNNEMSWFSVEKWLFMEINRGFTIVIGNLCGV